jgi:hypothetical protein
LLNRPTAGIDDADIFLVYARNFVHGHGLVYNIGGEHVEGFSSFLFFLVCAAAYACSSSPEALLFAANLIFAVLTALCILSTLAAITEHLGLSRKSYFLFVAAYLLWIGANPLYFAWNVVALMDAGLYSLIVTASFALLARILLRGSPPTPRQSLWLSALIALTVLVRPEGLLWAPLQFAAFAWITLDLSATRREALARLQLPLASLILTPAALILFRLAYFGYPFPNTYYAKVTSSLLRTIGDGKRYFGFFTSLYGIIIYIPLAIDVLWLAFTVIQRRPRTRLFAFVSLAAGFAFIAFIMPILEGGEHFASFRMYQAVWPILFLSLLLPALILSPRLSRQLGYFAILIVLIGLTSKCTWPRFASNNRANLTPLDDRMSLELGFRLTHQERENGERLHTLLQNELPTTGVAAAGGFAYGYNGTVYDLLGLNDIRMAHADRIKDGPKDHQSFNRGVFFQLSPDALMPWTMPDGSAPNLLGRTLYFSDPNQWDNVILKNIFNDPLFKATYTPAIVSSDTHPGLQCFAYFSNAYLARLTSDKTLHLTFLPGHAAAS